MDIKYELAHTCMPMCTDTITRRQLSFICTVQLFLLLLNSQLIVENCNMNQKLNLKKKFKIQKVSIMYTYSTSTLVHIKMNDY